MTRIVRRFIALPVPALFAIGTALLLLAYLIAAPVFAQAPPTTGAVLTAATQTVYVNTGGQGGVGISLQGTWSGTITFEGTIDGSNWALLNMTPTNSVTAATTSTGVGIWQGNAAGLTAVRARCSAYSSGSIQVTLQTSQAH